MVKFLIQRPIAVTVTFIAFIVMSLVAAGLIPVSLMPGIDRITSYNVCYTKLLRDALPDAVNDDRCRPRGDEKRCDGGPPLRPQDGQRVGRRGSAVDADVARFGSG